MSYIWMEPEGPNPPKFCSECGGAMGSTDRTERIRVSCPDTACRGCAVAHFRRLRIVRAWCPKCEPRVEYEGEPAPAKERP